MSLSTNGKAQGRHGPYASTLICSARTPQDMLLRLVALLMVVMLVVAAPASASSPAYSSAKDLMPPGYSPASPEFNHGKLALELAHAGFAHEAHASFRAAANFEGSVQVSFARRMRGEQLRIPRPTNGLCMCTSRKAPPRKFKLRKRRRTRLFFANCGAVCAKLLFRLSHNQHLIAVAEPHELWRLQPSQDGLSHGRERVSSGTGKGPVL